MIVDANGRFADTRVAASSGAALNANPADGYTYAARASIPCAALAATSASA